MVMIHAHAKGQGQRSFGSKVRAETDGLSEGRTDVRMRLHYLPC